MVMGDKSICRGCGFESQYRILDGNDVFHIDLLKNCVVCLKKTKNKQKEAEVGPSFKKSMTPSTLHTDLLYRIK